MLSTTIKRTMALALSGAAIAVAAGAPAASAMPADPVRAPAVAPVVDLRSPDTRDAAAAATTVDLRSPDTRDAAAGLVPAEVAPAPSGTTSADDGGFDLGSTGGIAAVLVGMLIVSASVVGVRRQRGNGRLVA